MDDLELPKYTDYISILHAFEVAVENYKDKPLVHYQAAPKSMEFKTLTYREVDIITTYLANKWGPILLPAISSDEAQCVATLGHESSVQSMLMFFTILKLGLPYFTIPSNCDKTITTHLLKLGKPGYIIASNTYFKTKLHLSTTMTINDVTIPVEPWEEYDMDYLIKVATTAAKKQQYTKLNGVPVNQESPAFIVATGGTTSDFPNIIVRSNQSMLYCLNEILLKSKDLVKVNENNNNKDKTPLRHPVMKSTDIGLMAIPLDRFSTIGDGFLWSMLVGSAVLVFHHDPPPTMHEILAVIKNYKVTWMRCTVTQLNRLGDYYTQELGGEEENAEIIPATALEAFKGCLYGGAPVRLSTEKTLKAQGFKLTPVYAGSAMPYLSFELFDQDMYQLVIRNNYPGLPKGIGNRPNGDFVNGDLFVTNDKHKSHNIWTFVGRVFHVFTMESGKKVCPTRMELEVCYEDIIQNCALIGENRKCTAIIVELSVEKAVNYSPNAMITKVYEAVHRANKYVPKHYTVIVPDMVYILPLNKRLSLTVKDTVFHPKVIAEFAQEIEQMYNNNDINASVHFNNNAAAIEDLSVKDNNEY
ncbi:hypothetical protein BDA99DRAFT_556470 [Phascolomyces articulosus]|uniref:AMP-dependent synthetase/ligase domain-containing protein n=1 Tax=Phascolomyces articulosus TaxID=60185 RepID=A0AAD5K7M9_9FUNG|nr:hypothetical protein BDA99DRAFT_556470 [Phascolomyces articulosus]